MSRRVLARSAVLLFALGLFAALVPAGTALADASKVGVDGTNWFWQSQERRQPSEILRETGLADLGVGCPPFAPLCPDPVVGLPNPHEAGALPVMVLNGGVEKVSGIHFDLEFLPVQGAIIDKFTFTVIESIDPRDEFQTFNADGREILACLIEDILITGEDGAEDMDDVPPFDCEGAPKGVRKADADPVVWEFDATELVQPWGDDPFSINGIMLVPVAADGGISETWQIVLKGPRRDTDATPDDEQALNANNIKAKIEYTPKPEIPDDGDDGGSGGFTPPPPPPPPPPSPEPSPSPVPTDTGGGDGTAEPVSNSGPVGSMWYIWLLLPAAIFGIAMARAAILEPSGGRRPDGVVAMIRAQNAARRGWTAVPDDPLGPGARLTSPFSALYAAVASDLSNARSKLTRKKRP
jgi:hypothetical protein